MNNRITLEELESYLWQSAVLLRTNIDAGSYKQYIFPLMFFKRICDVYDEETRAAVEKYGDDVAFYPEEELHTFIVPRGHHWRDVRQVTEDVGQAIVAAFRAIEKENGELLTGIFGDGAWTNKNRLPDLLEHFSSRTLSLENCPEDELGQGYEYLIKKFADDSGHTAQEFYTNRTVVHLMTEILQPQSGESIYDPTCGSAGMLISCIAHLKARGQEWRNVHVYGQEINALTSAIGRMNLFLHGVEDFHIVNDDTLKNPAFIKNGQLMQFDLVLANPPYSIKQWDRAAFETDKYGRNAFGTPPQARADYAFIQHIIASLKPDTGRAAILLPHGVLNRNEEKEIRKSIAKSDCIDAVIGLGRHLFYNSGLESCILLLRMNKPAVHRGTVLFIEAEKCTHKVQAQNYLFDEDIQKIVSAYLSDEDVPNFSRRVSMDEILANEGNLNIKMYVNSDIRDEDDDCGEQLEAFFEASSASHAAYNELVDGNPDESGAFDHATVSFANIDKSQWKRVKLSDVAEEYAERIDDPSESDYEWYIGSDCIGGYDFRITKRQPASKIHSAQKLFKKGDYLLVRRSLYGSDFRERAPRADFDGICSADILTIREMPGMVADGFLIAVLYSSRLWDFIVRESTGSLTRRIKWNQLKDFEFDLPPYDQQQKIASMLWGMDAAQSAYKHLIEMSDEYVKSQFIEMFRRENSGKQDWPTLKIGEVYNVKSSKRIYAKELVPAGIPFLKVADILDRIATGTSTPTAYISQEKYRELKEMGLVPETGDILVTSRGTIGKCYIITSKDEFYFQDGMISWLHPKPGCQLLPEFIAALFEEEEFLKALDEATNKTTVTYISLDKLGGLSVICPPERMQHGYLDFVEQLDKSKYVARKVTCLLHCVL